MYCSHFGLQRLPFNNTPDPTFYYSTPDHEEALATLQYATQQRKGFVLVTGEIGAGKTLIGRIFLRQIDASATTAVISQTNLTGRQLLAAICSEFGLPAPAEATSLELTQRLQEFLVEQFARNRFVVVLLDEAQNLPDESFEELRMLGNLEADDAKLLQVCILGQPELRERFRKPGMKQLDQRLFRRFHLPSLGRPQTGEYIIHRLGVAGGRNEKLFTKDAIEKIYAASGGVPRLINQICDNALLTAYGQDARSVDGRTIDLIIERDSSLGLPPTHPSTAAVSPGIPTTASVGRLQERIAEVETTSTDSVRLAELALQQTESLCDEVATLAAASAPVQHDMGKIVERQNELHKIVAGATTRWLAAKEKLDEYRKEIQSEIREVIVRCHHTQERLQEVERTAAPAEDLDEIRENHLRETNRLLKQMQSQRDDFQSRLDAVQQQWSSSEQELRRLATQTRADERFNEVRQQCEQATREALGTVDRHRQSMIEHIGALRQQCESAHQQLQTVQLTFERRTAEADRRVEQLRSDQTTHERDLAALREQIAQWKHGLVESVEQLKARVGMSTDGGHRSEQDAKRAQERLTSLSDELREQQTAASAALARRIDEQAGLLSAFRQSVAQTAEQSDLLHKTEITDISRQIARLGSQLSDLKKELSEANVAWSGQLQELQSRFASADQVAHLQAIQKNQSSEIHAVLAECESTQQSLGTVQDGLNTVSEQLADTQGQLKDVQALQVRPEQLTELRSEQQQAIKKILRHVHVQRRALRDRWQSVSEHCRLMQTSLDELNGKAASAADVEALCSQFAEETRQLHDTLAQQEHELDALTSRVRQQSESLGSRIEALAGEMVRPEDVAVVRQALQAQIESLSQEVSANQEQWTRAMDGSRERTEQTAAELARHLRNAQNELETVQKNQQQLRTSVHEELTRHADDQQEQLRRLEAQLSAAQRHAAEQQARLEERIQDARTEAETEVNRVQDRIVQAELEQQDTQRELKKQLAEEQSRHSAAVAELNQRWDALRARLDDVARDTAPNTSIARLEQQIQDARTDADSEARRIQDQLAQAEMEQEDTRRELWNQISQEQNRHETAVAELNQRWNALRERLDDVASNSAPKTSLAQLEQSLSADVTQVRQVLAATTAGQTQTLHTLVDKLQETAGRVSTLESDRHQLKLQPQVLSELSELVKTAETQRSSLTESLERTGAITAHFRNCSSQVQEIMEHWMNSAGTVREQSEGLRTSAESSKNILKAMRQCNAALDAKINSQRWRSEMERGEALAGRLERSVGAAQAIVHRLESLLADFDACRADADAWEQRQKQAHEAAVRLSQLLNQAKSADQRLEKSVESRQQLLTAVARNTSQLVGVIQAARVADETQRPTGPRTDAAPSKKPTNGHAARIEWPKLTTPLSATNA